MLLTQVRACDFPGCKSLACEACFLCGRDLCEQHKGVPFFIAPCCMQQRIEQDAPRQVLCELSSIRSTVLSVCGICTMHATRARLWEAPALIAALNEARDVYVEHLRAAWVENTLKGTKP